MITEHTEMTLNGTEQSRTERALFECDTLTIFEILISAQFRMQFEELTSS